MDYYPKACFITLTYNEEHLPHCPDVLSPALIRMPTIGTLQKRDLQNFFKLVRRHYTDMKFKYFAVGDYGEDADRPHYHVIWLGVSQNWEGFVYRKTVYSKGKQVDLYEVDEWIHGYVHVGTVEMDSVRYVTDYATKSLNGIRARETYGVRELPFKIASQGLGKRYCEKHAEELKRKEQFLLRGVHYGLPRYYRDILGIKNPNYITLLNDRAFMRGLDTFVMLLGRTGSTKKYELAKSLVKMQKQKGKNLISLKERKSCLR